MVFSQLKRFLEHEGLDVTFVANITDINDKIYEAAAAAGRDSAGLAREMAAAYVEDTGRIGLGRPDHEPLASETVGPIVELIETLVERDHAYAAGGDVYFRVRSLDGYGSLSGRDIDQMDQGEGVEGAERKEDPLDFALWKGEKEGEDSAWDSPWGRGRPGWHIECSAMAEQLLGLEFDIHGGGVDLVFPHHENEAAQTLAGRGQPLARIWMHNGMIELAGPTATRRCRSPSATCAGSARCSTRSGSETLLLYFTAGHYRQPMAFSGERLEEASRAVARIREAGRRVGPGESPAALAPHRDAFFDALADDFNTARALAALYGWIREANQLHGGSAARTWARCSACSASRRCWRPGRRRPRRRVALAERRAEARAARDWGEADRLRDELAAMGWEVRDGPAGPELVPAG